MNITSIVVHGARAVAKIMFDTQDAATFHQEVAVMYQLHACVNISRLLGYVENPKTIVLKYYPLGSLEGFVRKGIQGFPYTYKVVFNLAHGIASGLFSMHRRMLAHSDIKSANVLLEQVNGPRGPMLRAILTDFGICKVLSPQLRVKHFTVDNVQGVSLLYASPEVLRAMHKDGTIVSDPKVVWGGVIYAWAMVVYEMLTRVPPWFYT